MRKAFAVLMAVGLVGQSAQAGEGAAYPGRIEAINRVDVSAQVEGVITQIHFQPGQLVAEGDLLYSLDDTEFDLDRRTALAIATRARALLQDARRELDRNQALRQRGTISDANYFKSIAAEAIAVAALTEAESRLAGAKLDLARTQVRAPIAGIISPSKISRGSFVETGRKGVLATIVQLDPVRVAYAIPYPERLIELDITTLNTISGYADTVDLRVDLAPGWTHPELAEPTYLSADVNPETRSITAWATVANPTHTLRPGMEVTVRPIAEETVVPDRAD